MADEGHIPAGLMRRFLSSDVSQEEAQRVTAHLIHGCGECSALVQQFLPEGIGGWCSKPGVPASTEQLEEVFRRVVEATTVEARRLALEKLQPTQSRASSASAKRSRSSTASRTRASSFVRSMTSPGF